jgi:hypothetical protein
MLTDDALHGTLQNRTAPTDTLQTPYHSHQIASSSTARSTLADEVRPLEAPGMSVPAQPRDSTAESWPEQTPLFNFQPLADPAPPPGQQ